MKTHRSRARHLVLFIKSKNNQKGFTLIELLVVISILGILAAVVTMSMVGITTVATQRAAETEAKTVQAAMDTMLADQEVDPSLACSGNAGPTNDMSIFPNGNAFTVSGGTGSLGQHQPVQLFDHYLRDKKTHGTYSCGADGQIHQDSYTP